ncbi:MAG: twin-arginine translocase subunit TatC [Candidatus Omnitrophica bacterium]|nr:twin-arginine translocase subunit TatC [Candidatus Omnitrophota bacterium]
MSPAVTQLPESAVRERTLTVAEHLEELRRRLGVCLAVWLAASAVALTQADRLLAWLQQPAASALPRLAYFSPTEPLAAYLKLAALGGTALAMPVILWQMWAFVRSGLTAAERALGAAFVGWGSAQFVAGMALAYYGLLPVSLRVLLSIGRRQLEPVISVDAYLSFAAALLGWCGLVAELPVILWLLACVGLVTPEWLRQQRPYALLVLVILAAVITPTTDPVNLLLMTVPLWLLYEGSILITRWAMSRRSPSPRGAR